MRNDKLRKPHWGEGVCFERIPGSIQVYIQDRTCPKNELAFPVIVANRFTRTNHPGVVDQHVYTTRFPEHLVDDTLAIFFIGHIQDDLSETQSVSELCPVLPIGAKSPFRFFREKTHPLLRVCVPLRRLCTPRKQMPRIFMIASARRLSRPNQKAYSANPIPPFEQPVTRTTFDSVLADMSMRRVKPEKFRCEGRFTARRAELHVTGMEGSLVRAVAGIVV